MKKVRQYILPISASDEMDSLNTLLGGMGNNENSDSASEDEANSEEEQGDEQQEEQQEEQQQKTAPQPDKASHAFAEMRVQMNNYKTLLSKLATANGIQFGNDKELFDKLNDEAINSLAKKQNVPVELLKRMDTLEKDSAELQQTRLKDAALIGFQNVMSTYKLDQKQLQSFAQELDAAGKNPFTSPIDLVQEYKMLHFDDILNAQVEAAVQAALAKSSKADTHSTVPNKQVGGGNSTGEKVTTLSGLNSLLAGMK